MLLLFVPENGTTASKLVAREDKLVEYNTVFHFIYKMNFHKVGPETIQKNIISG